MSRKEEILKGANPAQQAVIKSIYGKYVVWATAGSGKTRSIVLRTAYMIENGIPAEQILMFTFTRKAANEMKERIEKLIGSKAKGMTISTYHSFCGKLLRQYAHIVGLQSNYTIYDEEDSMTALKQVISVNQALQGIEAKDVKQAISIFKENLVSPEEALTRSGSNSIQRQKAIAYRDYAAYLRRSNALDFDDLPYFAVKALQQSETMRQQVNAQYRYITADEFQDSSQRDVILMSLLAGPDSDQWNLCVVGDIDQSIYSFRGANVSAVINFVQQQKLVQLNMGQNYRSTRTIVEAADSVIRNNKVRIEKEVFTENEQGTMIRYYTCADNQTEAEKVATVIKKIVTARPDISYNDIAILYRTRGQSRILEAELTKQGIPIKVLAGLSFFARRVVKDLLAYVRLVVNPNDREAFRRIVNVPNRHIGEASLKTILAYLEVHEEASLFDACRNVTFRQRDTKKGVENFISIIQALCEVANYINDSDEDDSTVNAAVIVRETYNIINYGDYIQEQMFDDVEQHESDVSALIDFASEYKSVNDFVAAVVEQDVNQEKDDQEANTVKLLTMHGSKGLEWPVVFIVGNCNGTIPLFRAVNDGNIEEERRLFYVAMTRAKKLLILTRPKTVTRNGRQMSSMENPFIKEIKAQYIRRL